MKKRIATVLVLLTCGFAHALPVGNPSEAKLFSSSDCCDPCFRLGGVASLRVGFSGDYVFNRYLKTSTTADSATGGGVINTASIHTNSGYLALNICDYVDFFTRIGSSQLSIESDNSDFFIGGTPGTQTEFRYSSKFSWSVGTRATIWEYRCFSVGIEGEYFQVKPEEGSFVQSLLYAPLDLATTYREWQVGLGASYRFASTSSSLVFIPYVAVKYSRSKWDWSESLIVPTDPQPTFNFEADKYWGAAVGLSFTVCNKIGVSVEGRFFDEKALYVNGQFSF